MQEAQGELFLPREVPRSQRRNDVKSMPET